MLSFNDKWILSLTLPVLSQVVDEIYILDDGSTDGTKELCSHYKAVYWKLGHHPQPRRLLLEGARRQELVDWVTVSNCDYLLFLDADEIPSPNFWDSLPALEESKFGGVSAPVLHLWGGGGSPCYRSDQYVSPLRVRYNWNGFDGGERKHPMVKHKKNYAYKYNTEVQAGGCSPFPQAPANVPHGPFEHQAEWFILHFGYLSTAYLSGAKRRKYQTARNAGRASVLRALDMLKNFFEARVSARNVQLTELPGNLTWDFMKTMSWDL